MPFLFLVFLVGACGALLGAMLGVGGGIVMVPAFVKLGMTMKQAIATSLAVIVVTSLTSTTRYAFAKEENFIRWDVVTAAACGAIIAALLGAELMKSMSAVQLKVAFGVFLIAVGLYMLATAKPVTP